MNKRALIRHGGLVLLLLSLWQVGSAGYIAAKAELAQVLLEYAWQRSHGGAEAVRPWPSADTWPTARLAFPQHDTALIVLSGASARNLAFGPVEVARSGGLITAENLLIAGHRDTHFRVLGELQAGDDITLERPDGTRHYHVTDSFVIDQDAAGELADDDSLLLITCYPVGGVNPGTRWRYVVRARPEVPAAPDQA